MTEKQALIDTYEAARKAVRLDPAKQVEAIRASAALSAWIMANEPPKARGRGSRAGRRQQAERRGL